MEGRGGGGYIWFVARYSEGKLNFTLDIIMGININKYRPFHNKSKDVDISLKVV